ncbi:MAG: radical SAM protein [Acidimicrobiales bacterium]|nr:radical SAM protein [Acidimicrobiales bacterium]
MRSSVQRVVLRSRRRLAGARAGEAAAEAGAPSDEAAEVVRADGRRTYCNAPSTSLYLDQHGDVRACCQNAEYPLGNITEASLLDIWHGERTASLRTALRADDLTLGCQFCRWQRAEDNDALVYARTFDHLELPEGRPEWPQQLELSMSNACNLQCIMCNGDWSSSIRTHREGREPLPVVYDEAFFDELAQFLPHLKIVKILGGEPFLSRESLRVLDMLVEAGLTPEVHVTTNGTQWTPRVERIMERLPMHVIVSLDGCDAETYEAIRQGSDFEVVMANLDRFRTYADRHGTDVNLAHCLMTTNWHRFADFLRFADERDLPVGVNTVTSPIELSLHHLHPDRLDEVVAELDAIDEQVRADLGRNRPVWTDQIDRLHHRQRALADFTDVSYYLGREILSVPWRRRPDGRDHQAEARDLLATLPTTEIGPVLVVDDTETVIGVEPVDRTELAGVDLLPLIGRHGHELFGIFGWRHGADSPGVLTGDPDLQHWRVRYDGDTGLVIEAVVAPVVDHAGVATEVRVHLAAHLAPSDEVADEVDAAAPAPDEAELPPVRDVQLEPATPPQPIDLDVWFRAQLAGAAVHELLIDQGGTVLAIGPEAGDVVGLDLSGLVGGSVADLIEAFVPAFGSLEERSEQPLPADAPRTARLERVVFGQGTQRTSLLVVMDAGFTRHGHPGMRVLLGRAPDDPSAGP